MKKRLLSFVLALLMLSTLFLASCADTRTPEEIMEDIAKNSKDVALKFSIYVPTDADTSSPEFQERLAAVQEAINSKLRQDCTEIEIIAIKDSEYDAKVSEKMAAIKANLTDANGNIITNKKPSFSAPTKIEQNVAEKVVGSSGKADDFTIQLKYPDIQENQIDIILIRSEEDYIKYYSNGQLSSWKNDLANSGKYYRINKIVKQDILNVLKVKNGDSIDIYGIPNNHLYTDANFKYLMIDKSVAESVEGFDIKNFTDDNGALKYDVLESFMESAKALKDVVPFVATENDAPISYWGNSGDFSLVGSNGAKPDSIFNDASYVSFMKLLKKYGTAASESKAAVSYFTGKKADAAAKENDYYMIQVGAPEITAEEVFSSVFAVTDYSANYARAKDLVFTLQSDDEIRTLLQYGIKGEDYEINDGVLEMIKDNDGDYAYKMNPLYTGNGYITYAGEGVPMSYWEDVKAVNYVAKTNPYIGMEAFFNKYADKAGVLTNVSALKSLNDSVKAKIADMDAEEFEEFINEWNNSSTENSLVKSIKDSEAYTKSLAKLGDLYNKYAEEVAAKGKVETSTATVSE